MKARSFPPSVRDGRLRWIALVAALLAAGPASAAVETVIADVEALPSGRLNVVVTFLNGGDRVERFSPPSEIAGELLLGRGRVAVPLRRAEEAPAKVEVAPSSFVRATYELAVPERLAEMLSGGERPVLLLPDSGGAAFAFAVPPAAETPAPRLPEGRKLVFADPPAVENAFIQGFSADRPIYATFGTGTNSDGLIQLSFKYRLFGEDAAITDGRSWLNGIHFAYTQRMFWNVGEASFPFRSIDFSPELMYTARLAADASGRIWAVRAGYKHESNGEDGADSRSTDRLYVQPSLTMPLGGGTQLRVAPMFWTYVGESEGAEDIRDYRGNGELNLELGNPDGLYLATMGRISVGTGRGAVEAQLSYPLRDLVPGLNLYFFSQAFAGYGENLLDYNVRTSRLRFGIGLVR